MGRSKKPTCTHLVLEYLRALDDFANRDMILTNTGITRDQLSITVHGLRKVHAIDVVIQPNGEAWWYALPPEFDQRHRHVEEIAEGITRKFQPRKRKVGEK